MIGTAGATPSLLTALPPHRRGGPATQATAAPRAPTPADAALCNAQARAKTGRPEPRETPTLTPAPRMRTDRSGSLIAQAPDPLLEGMAAPGFEDGAYRTAYRACVEERTAGR